MDIKPDIIRQLFVTMARIRLFEEKIAEVYAEQEMKCPVHLCIGQEAIAAGVCIHLQREDFIFSTHRSHGHCIAKGMALKPIAAELYGRTTGCAGGRGGSMHLVDFDNGIPGTTAIVGGCIPLAVGAGLAFRLRGEPRVSVAFFGDGAADEGVFQESLNFASLKKLPVVFVCENNFYATNSHRSARQPDIDIAARATGFGIPSRYHDGNDVLTVYESAMEAVERARKGDGPTLLEYQTYRWKGHVGPSCDVESGCRPQSEFDKWVERCPYEFFRQYLLKTGIMGEKEMADITNSITNEIGEALKYGKESPEPKAEELHDHI